MCWMQHTHNVLDAPRAHTMCWVHHTHTRVGRVWGRAQEPVTVLSKVLWGCVQHQACVVHASANSAQRCAQHAAVN